jgi:hypothetical protein
VIDVPVRDIPEGGIPFYQEAVRDDGDRPLGLIVLAQKKGKGG